MTRPSIKISLDCVHLCPTVPVVEIFDNCIVKQGRRYTHTSCCSHYILTKGWPAGQTPSGGEWKWCSMWIKRDWKSPKSWSTLHQLNELIEATLHQSVGWAHDIHVIPSRNWHGIVLSICQVVSNFSGTDREAWRRQKPLMLLGQCLKSCTASS